MVTVSFTGSRRLPPACEDQVWARLRRLADQANNGMISEFVSGAADGIDTFVAVNLSAWCPDTRHRLVVPAAGHNRLLAQEWESSRNPNLKVERMLVQPGPAALQYRLRDQRMVDLAAGGWVEAFPLYEEQRQPRSGTWLTVRLARKAGVKLTINILEPRPALF